MCLLKNRINISLTQTKITLTTNKSGRFIRSKITLRFSINIKINTIGRKVKNCLPHILNIKFFNKFFLLLRIIRTSFFNNVLKLTSGLKNLNLTIIFRIYWIIYNINIIIPGFLIVKALINILKQGFITRILYLKIIFSNRASFAIGARRKNISPATILNRPPRILEKMENRLMIASTSFLYIRKKTNKIFITSFKRKLFSIKAFFSIRSKKFSRGLEKII